MTEKSYLFTNRNVGSALPTIRRLVRTPPDAQFRSIYPAQLQGPMAGIGRETTRYNLHVLEVNSDRNEAAAVGNQAYQMLYGEGEPMM